MPKVVEIDVNSNAVPLVTDRILNIEEVAAELGCSKGHVYNAINGKVCGVSALPAIQMGRRSFVRRSTFERWKQENERVRR